MSYSTQGLFLFVLLFFNVLKTQAQTFRPQTITLRYSLGEGQDLQELQLPWADNYSNEYFRLRLNINEEEGRIEASIRAFAAIHFQSIQISMPYSPTSKKVSYFCNGFQSWTESREYEEQERIARLSPLLKAYAAKAGDHYFYDYPRKKGQLHSWTWTYIRSGESDYQVIASLSETSGFTVFRFDTPNKMLYIEKDVEGLQLQADQSLELFELLYTRTQKHEAYREFMEHYAQEWQLKYGATTRANASPMMGWTSWYHYYDKIDEKIIKDNLEAFAQKEIPIDIFQIDDGYQKAVGDWLQCNKKFPGGMKAIAEAIHRKGFKAGIWLAPFIASKKSDTFRNNPHWFVKDSKGKPLPIARNVIWGGPYYALDIYQPEARAYIKKVLHEILEEWGYDLIKVDFLFAACVVPHPNRSRGQIMYDAMQLLHETAGPDKLILGCGVPLASSFGLVDYCRIGNDVHLAWEFKILKALRSYERPSTISTLRNSLYRQVLSGNMFRNDPDVFILRSQKQKLTEAQQYTLFLLNHILGELLFCSDYIADYSAPNLQLYLSGFPLRHRSNIEIEHIGQDTYRLLFRIGLREYVTYANLGTKQAEIEIAPRHRSQALGYYNASSNQVLSTIDSAAIHLPAYTSHCFYVLKGEDIELLGGEGHLFSGAEVNALEWGEEGTMRLSRHPKTQVQKPIYFRVNDNSRDTVICNEQAYPVQQFSGFRGIKID